MLIYSLTERTQYTIQVIGSPLEANFNPKNTVTKCMKSSLSLVKKSKMLKGSGQDWARMGCELGVSMDSSDRVHIL